MWLRDYAQHNVSARTYERYAGIVRNHLVPALGSIQLSKLRPQQIQAYYSEALESGRMTGRGGPLSARTVLHHHRVLREALQQAVRWQLLSANAADAVEPPRPVRTEMRVLGPEGVASLLEACAEEPTLRMAVYLAVSTGLRLGELLGLKWSDIDLEARSLQVVRSLQYISGQGLRFGEPKTSRSRRRVALSEGTVAELRRHRRRQIAERLASSDYSDLDLVLCDGAGAPIPPYQLSQRFSNLVKSAGLAPHRFHDLRHTSATLLLRAGVHPKIVSERLGHSSVAITLDTYSHVLPDMQEEAAREFDAWMVGG